MSINPYRPPYGANDQFINRFRPPHDQNDQYNQMKGRPDSPNPKPWDDPECKKPARKGWSC